MNFEIGPLEPLFGEIEAACEAGLFYVAVSSALTIPDVCAGLERPNGKKATGFGERYRTWFSYWFHPRLQRVLTAADAWDLRCGVSHAARMGQGKSQRRVVFTFPLQQGGSVHGNDLGDLVTLDASLFCDEMIRAARAWWLAKRTDPTVRANLPHLVRYGVSQGGGLPAGFGLMG